MEFKMCSWIRNYRCTTNIYTAALKRCSIQRQLESLAIKWKKIKEHKTQHLNLKHHFNKKKKEPFNPPSKMKSFIC